MKRLLVTPLLFLIVLASAFGVEAGLELNALYHYHNTTVQYDNSSYPRTELKGGDIDFRFTAKSLFGDSYGVSFYGGATKTLAYQANGVDFQGDGWGWYYGANNLLLFDLGYMSQLEFAVGYDTAYQDKGSAEARVDSIRTGLKYNMYDRDGFFYSLGLEVVFPYYGRIIDYGNSDYSTRWFTRGSVIGIIFGVGYHTW